ncbi:hydroxyacylglutathione hydrolase C-terminal domain-containing protein [Ramlibacter sp. PS4R-6]|uniref:hydroxyacylglutathione hydrolase C-terminal domain-containing protein n=1 Tax=Ramlibacter sp. PS4R-6 TaxID=3133438 RepID=UPI0030ABAA01
MRLTPLPAFQDNYLWFLHDGQRALVDAGDAQPVKASLQREGLELGAILVIDLPGHAAPARMRQSLEKLASWPGGTRVCRTHEYTLSNLKFARAAEPGNLQLIHCRQRCEELRAQGLPTLPSSGPTAPDEVSVFATFRPWKNGFQ